MLRQQRSSVKPEARCEPRAIKGYCFNLANVCNRLLGIRGANEPIMSELVLDSGQALIGILTAKATNASEVQ